MLKVVLGKGELPFLLEGAGAVGVRGELFGEDAADGEWVRVDLEEDAGARVGAEGVVGEVAIGDEACAGAHGKAAGGTAKGCVGRANGAAAEVEGEAADAVEQECLEAGDEAVADTVGGQRGRAALAQEGTNASGKEAAERAGPGPVGGPEEIGDEGFEQARLGEREGDLVIVARAAVDEDGAA